MIDIEAQLVPYDVALSVRKLGFDEPCFGTYDINTEQLYSRKYETEQTDFLILAPYWNQIVYFIECNYKISILPCINEDDEEFWYGFKLWSIDDCFYLVDDWSDIKYDSQFNAIKTGVVKAIEIINDKKYGFILNNDLNDQ